MKRVLLIGSGAREHALAAALLRGKEKIRLLCAPGNAGTADIAENLPLPELLPVKLLALAEAHRADLVIVGPEAPLVGGAADALREAGFAVFGPGAMGARLEGSKAFAKEFLRRHHIPSAEYRIFESHAHAVSYVRQSMGPCVVKADGLTAGKGVFVCNTSQEAEKALHQLMVERTLGEAGMRVVVEERLMGREASLFLLLGDGKATQFPLAQDFKRLSDGDLGPNTGGMGSGAPHPLSTPAVQKRLRTQVIDPILAGLKEEGIDYRGLLYVGLMLTEQGPQVLEFNCRFGDPETQALALVCRDSWLPALEAAAKGSEIPPVPAADGFALCRVIAGKNYPSAGGKPVQINGLVEAGKVPGVQIFHAGTQAQEGQIWGGPGRMLSVCAYGDTLETAGEALDRATALLTIEGAQWRTDLVEKLQQPDIAVRVPTRVSRGEGGIDPPAPIHPFDARRGGRGIPGKSPWLPGGGGKGSRPGSPGHRARPGGGSRKGR